MRLEFFIPYTVQAKQADRSRVVEIPSGGRFVHHYQSSKVKKNAKSLLELLAVHVPDTPMVGPVDLDIIVQYPYRKSEPKRNRNRTIPKDTKPDTEQLLKQLCDVFESMGFVTNDAQFSDVRIRKVWTDSPGVQVVMESMT